MDSHNYIAACAACQWPVFLPEGDPLGPGHQNDGQIILCSVASWHNYHIYCGRIMTTMLFTPVSKRKARFALSNLANVQYAYELAGRELN